MAKVVIVLDLKTCKRCPNFDERPGEYVSPDSFEAPNHDWYCKKTGQKIQGYVEWHEEKKIPVPDWCPCLENPIVESTEFKLPPYRCDNCKDTGQYHIGGSFGGGVTVLTCPCGVWNTLREE
jgi:hypothetical protein